jgi:hypothetical protein
MELDQIEARLAPHHLSVLGGFHPDATHGAPKGCQTLLMIGPREPGFWAHVTGEAEFSDGAPDPLDRWSRRVIGTLACDLGGKAMFPFGGPPYRPFIAWAKATGRAWSSPVGLLVHDEAGLMISFRGALALVQRIALPPNPAHPPCDSCARPCESACPVGALGPSDFDVTACHAYLATAAGQECLDLGCRARRACPVSQGYGRRIEQSAYHMRSFHP